MKSYFLCFLIFLSYQVQASFIAQTEATLFDVDGCFYGESGSWTGACSCYPFYGKSGTYCNETPQKECSSSTDCKQGFYCNTDLDSTSCQVDLGKGRCFKKMVYPLVEQKKEILISKSIMNWWSAESFCESLGQNWRLATRLDFDCIDNGPLCIENSFLTDFQKTVGIRGFLWLDKAGTCQAYYMDLNDGNIYSMDKNKATNSQAICIHEGDLK